MTVEDERESEDVRELTIAVGAAQRLVAQSRSHIERTTRKLSDRMENAAASTPCGIDIARMKEGRHRLAYHQLLTGLGRTSNTLLSHLRGLDLLLDHGTFYPLPAMSVTRSFAEVASTAVWRFQQDIDADGRAARGYASVFAFIEDGIASATRPERRQQLEEAREQMIVEVMKQNSRPGSDLSRVKIHRRAKDGAPQEDVAQVTVGRASAKVRFQYSQRMNDGIPLAGGLYSQMSAAAHGNQSATHAAFDTPASFARGIAHVVLEATKAWSLSIHTWLGATPAPFWSEIDLNNLRESMPTSRQAELIADLSEEVAAFASLRQNSDEKAH